MYATYSPYVIVLELRYCKIFTQKCPFCGLRKENKYLCIDFFNPFVLFSNKVNHEYH